MPMPSGVPTGSRQAVLLGCGTSTGVPLIGCDCSVCTSAGPRNRRLRCGLAIDTGSSVVLIDTPTDLRQQALTFGLRRVDAVVYTHSHADHILGLDELRIFNFRQQASIPCYGAAPMLENLRRSFHYIFEDDRTASSRPRIDLVPVNGPFEAAGLDFVPIPLWHGKRAIFGYRIGDLAYLTDCSALPDASIELLRGLDTLILGALRYQPHPTHFTVREALEAAAEIGARRTVLTHMSHEIDYYAPQVQLPAGVELGYDGIRFDIR